MKIYNTMSKRKEEFVPLEEGKVKMYAVLQFTILFI
jgi:cysteinyl-tRNA synthetase